MQQRAVFLDRDNTLIANDGDLGDPAQVHLLEGVAEGLRALHEAGFRLVVITNQGGVARGRFTERDVDAVHQQVARLVDETAGATRLIARFYYCPYHPDATVEEYRREHQWRKPNPGMLLQAAHDMGLDLAGSWLVGDQPRDVAAGQAAGTRTILLHDGDSPSSAHPTACCATFAEAVDLILAEPAPARPAGRRRGVEGQGPAGGATSLLTEVKPVAAPLAAAPAGPAPAVPAASPDDENLRQAVLELTEELRSRRLRATEFTTARMIAAVAQLAALGFGVIGLMQLDEMDLFIRWALGAALAQLLAITLLVADLKT